MKLLDISQPLQSFDGQPLKDGERTLTLKDILLAYLSQGHLMGLTPAEEGTAYGVGAKVGVGKGTVELETVEYDLLKKVCDSGKIKQQGQEVPLFSLVVSQQVKQLVDAAKTKEDKKA
jgi:hypothetical protein